MTAFPINPKCFGRGNSHDVSAKGEQKQKHYRKQVKAKSNRLILLK